MREVGTELSKNKVKPASSTKKDSKAFDFDPSKILGLEGLEKEPKIPKLADQTGELDELLKGLNLPETPKLDDLESALKDSLTIPTLDELEKEAKLKPDDLIKK